ncbi:MAG: hypothetical protein IV085_10470 [Thiobacillus sp.]|nr:hypothetical protein [Thiobacillus sp.]
MLRRLLVLLAKVVLVFALVWLVVIGYWQYTRRVVSSADLLVYLALLPLGLLVAYWLGKGAFHLGKKLQARRRDRAAQVHSKQEVSATGTAVPQPTTEPPILVLGSTLYSGLGDADMWIEKTRAYEIHHALDQPLTDALGWAIRSIRADQLDEDPSDDGLPHDMQPGVKRMTRMLQRVQEDLSDVVVRAATQAGLSARSASAHDKRVVLHPEWSGQDATPVERATEIPAPPVNVISSLVVFVFLPGFVTAAEAGAIKAISHVWAVGAGWTPQAVSVTPVIGQDTTVSLKRLGEILQQQVAKPGQLLVVLSAVSWLDESLLSEQLQRNVVWAERLRKSSTIVGEAAAGMVLSTAPLIDPDTLEAFPALAQLARLSIGERQKPIDVKGSVEAELLETLSQGLGRAYGIAPDRYAHLIATGDLWRGRSVELGRWLSDCLPHLSLVDDAIQVGQHLGECDPVCDLVALVLAVESCRQAEAPILFCSNHSTHWRGLSAVMPVPLAA